MTDEQNPTKKSSVAANLSEAGVEALLDKLKKGPPLPRCPRCDREIPGLYLYAFNMQAPGSSDIIVFQGVCCPFDDCHAVFNVYLLGKQAPTIAHPAGTGWPGLNA